MASDIDMTFGLTEEEYIEEGENWEKTRDRCLKENQHKNQNKKYQDIPVNETLDTLPEPYNKILDLYPLVRHMSSLTGKIIVGNVYCTGFVQAIRDGIFPKGYCKICRVNHEKGGRSYILIVTTALHVLERVTGEHTAKIDLSWHSNQLTAHFSRIVDNDKDYNEKDWCAAEFINHNGEQAETVAKLKIELEKFQNLQGQLYKEYKKGEVDPLVIIVSHPHGGPKQVSYCQKFRDRKFLKYTREDQQWCRYSYDAPTCKGCSGAPVFILGQPLSGYGYWLGHPHIHSRWKASEKMSYSSMGCDHIDRE